MGGIRAGRFRLSDLDRRLLGIWWPMFRSSPPPAGDSARRQNIVIQTTGQNMLMVSDAAPTPITGGIVLKSTSGAMIVVNDTGIYISDGQGCDDQSDRSGGGYQYRRFDGFRAMIGVSGRRVLRSNSGLNRKGWKRLNNASTDLTCGSDCNVRARGTSYPDRPQPGGDGYRECRSPPSLRRTLSRVARLCRWPATAPASRRSGLWERCRCFARPASGHHDGSRDLCADRNTAHAGLGADAGPGNLRKKLMTVEELRCLGCRWGNKGP